MNDQVERAVEHLQGHGFPSATREAVAAIADRYPWISRKPNGWQHLCRLYVERLEWR